MAKEEKGLSKAFWYTMFLFIITLVVIITAGLIIFSKREKKVLEIIENGGKIVLNYSSNYPGLQLQNVTPIPDILGMTAQDEGTYFDFSVKTTLDNANEIEYEISINKDKVSSTIPDEDIRIYLEQEESGSYTKVFEPQKYVALKTKTEYGSLKGSMVIQKVKKTKSGVDNFRLRIWANETSLVSNGNYSVEVLVKGKAS